MNCDFFVRGFSCMEEHTEDSRLASPTPSPTPSICAQRRHAKSVRQAGSWRCCSLSKCHGRPDAPMIQYPSPQATAENMMLSRTSACTRVCNGVREPQMRKREDRSGQYRPGASNVHIRSKRHQRGRAPRAQTHAQSISQRALTHRNTTRRHSVAMGGLLCSFMLGALRLYCGSGILAATGRG